MRAEDQIAKLQQEAKAIKASFEQSASMMEIYTATASITTQPNKVGYTVPSGGFVYDDWKRITAMNDNHSSDDPFHYYCDETVIVTFQSENGSNVLANLEFDENTDVIVTRLAFSGGAQWRVVVSPNLTPVPGTAYVEWAPTVINFAVQSSVKGTLEAKMIWE